MRIKNIVFALIAIAFLVSCGWTKPAVTSWEDTGKEVTFTLKGEKLTLIPLMPNVIRVQVTDEKSRLQEELVFTEPITIPSYVVKENEKEVVLSLDKISAVVNKKSASLVFKDRDGNILLREKENGRSMKDATVQGEPTFLVEQQFVSPADEYIFGTGQFQDGYLNIKGLTRRLTQVNTQISIPFILSNKGYGLLWHNYGLTDFNPADRMVDLVSVEGESERLIVEATSTSGNTTEVREIKSFSASLEIAQPGRYSILLDVGQTMARKHNLSIDGENLVDIDNIWLPPTTSLIIDLTAGKHEIVVKGEKNDKPVLYYRLVTDETVFRSPVAQALDYTVFAGQGEEVISSYRSLSGPAPLMPLWSMGYIHCRERYKTQDELLTNAREFRQRRLPLDLIVQDWQYWGKYGWNAMRFDETNYPDPTQMVDELHKMNMRLMVSVWSKIDPTSEVGKQMTEKGYYIPGSEWVDFFNPDAAAFYWKNFNDRLLQPHRIDAWWQDATEPENDDLQNRRIGKDKIPGEVLRNVYPLYVNKTVYEGSRRNDPGRRTMILTRSGFSGMQRYASATWSGDVGNDWETLRRQIAGGLSQMASGLPWWTYDAGGFFRPDHGQYTDEAYHERFLRWFQAGTFFPLLRVHGYMTDTEFWRFGKEVERVSLLYLNFRYRMLPYIYSRAAAITFEGSTMMRPFVMDFPSDKKALEQDHAFMFGPSLLVAPVTEAGVKQWSVYLPQNQAGWFDFWTGKQFKGGINTDVEVDMEKIPLFVKAGSILPLGPEQQYTKEKPDAPWEIRVYPGADASFTIYEDEGDNYNYEKGHYSTYELIWDDREQTLTIGDKKGSFEGMNKSRILNIVKVSSKAGIGMKESVVKQSVSYSGKQQKVKLSQ